MAVWRKHRFSGLNEDQDEQDKIIAGLEFFVRYVGSTYVKDDFENTELEKMLAEFIKSTVESYRQLSSKITMIQLVVDISGAVFYDCEGRALENFQLTRIRDVIYCNNSNQYANYFMLVGQAERDLRLKAHLLVCQTKEEAKYLYKTFIEAFKLGAHMSCRKSSNGTMSSQVYETRNGSSADPAVKSELTNVIKPSKSKASSSVNEDGNLRGLRCPLDNSKLLLPLDKKPTVVPHQEIDYERNSTASSYPDDDFTEFARSRSKSSTTSPSVRGNGYGFARLHSSSLEDDVFW